MRTGKQLFTSLVARVEQTRLFRQIIESEICRYQIQPLKSEKMDCATVKNIYNSLQFRYKETKELPEDPEGWNDNEKKLFIWIIIFYVYFRQKDGLEITQETWTQLSIMLFDKNPQFLRFQYLNLIKPLAKITWSLEEDNLLTQAVEAIEKGKWYEVSRHIFVSTSYTIFKSPKHCRERWLNHLDENKKRGNWTPNEDLEIFKFVAEYGKRWSKLVPVLQQTRTEHMIKNRYNSLVNKQKLKRKETEDHLVTRIVRQLKKQIANIQKRKLIKQEKEMEVVKNKEQQSHISQELSLPGDIEPIKQEHDEVLYKQSQVEDEEKAQQTPPSEDSSIKKEQNEDEATHRVTPQEEIQPFRAFPCPPMPFYNYGYNIQEYPFLYEQMHMMQYYSMYPTHGTF